MTIKPQPDDHPRTRKAIEFFNREKIPFKRPGPYQLKFGALNFFPTTNVITLDGSSKRQTVNGLDALLALLHQRGWPEDDDQDQDGVIVLKFDEHRPPRRR